MVPTPPTTIGVPLSINGEPDCGNGQPLLLTKRTCSTPASENAGRYRQQRVAERMTRAQSKHTQAARSVLGDAALIKFLRGLQDCDVHAVELFLEEVDRAVPVDKIFQLDADGYGFFLRLHTERTPWRLEFGCAAGPEEGDGAEWEIEPVGAGEIRLLRDGMTWWS